MKRYPFAISLLALLLLAACGGDPATSPITQPPTVPPTDPGGNTISGTVTAPGDVANTTVVACPNSDCESPQAVTAVTDASGNYIIANLAPGSYLIGAVKDANNSGAFDDGDYIGIYPSAESPSLVTPPASGINIAMQVQGGSTNPTPAPNPTPTPPPTPGGNNISGTVTAAAGGDIASTEVWACPIIGDSADCNNPVVTQITQSGPSGTYDITNLQPAQYGIIALQDINGDSRPDFAGVYDDTITPPASSINIQLEPFTPSNASSLGKLNVNRLSIEGLQSLLE